MEKEMKPEPEGPGWEAGAALVIGLCIGLALGVLIGRGSNRPAPVMAQIDHGERYQTQIDRQTFRRGCIAQFEEFECILMWRRSGSGQ